MLWYLGGNVLTARMSGQMVIVRLYLHKWFLSRTRSKMINVSLFNS